MHHTLPDLFLERLNACFSQTVVRRILSGFEVSRLPVLRINTLKSNCEAIATFLRQNAIRFERPPFLKDCFLLHKGQKENFFYKTPPYTEGHFYFQSLSSQLPPIFLNPQPHDNVLDMAAAPGSKTTQMAALMQNQGFILANELDPVRHDILKFNLSRQGVTIAETRLGSGVLLGASYPAFFDRVLLDVPCSAEGRIDLKQPRTYRFWSLKNIHQHSRLQKQLFLSAYRALKPGGLLVYSTCTLAPEENEKIADWALGRFSDLSVTPLTFGGGFRLPVLSRFEEAVFNPALQGALKLAPDDHFEGFFIVLFRKKP